MHLFIVIMPKEGSDIGRRLHLYVYPITIYVVTFGLKGGFWYNNGAHMTIPQTRQKGLRFYFIYNLP